jgi:hypothetical protein
VARYIIAESKLEEWAEHHNADWGYDLDGIPYIQMTPDSPRIYSTSISPIEESDND